jgi:hypothetical protein
MAKKSVLKGSDKYHYYFFHVALVSISILPTPHLGSLKRINLYSLTRKRKSRRPHAEGIKLPYMLAHMLMLAGKRKGTLTDRSWTACADLRLHKSLEKTSVGRNGEVVGYRCKEKQVEPCSSTAEWPREQC